MEKRYRIIIMLLVFIVVILSSILIYQSTGDRLLTKIPTPQQITQVIPQKDVKTKVINILSDHLANVPVIENIMLKRNSDNQVYEISNIIGNNSGLSLYVGDFPLSDTTDSDGVKTNNIYSPVTISFSNTKFDYPDTNAGWVNDPESGRGLQMVDYDTEVVKYTDSEISFWGSEGIILSDEVKTKCPKIKSYDSGYTETKEFIEIPNTLYIVVSYKEESGLKLDTCEKYESKVANVTKELVDQILKSIEKRKPILLHPTVNTN